MTPEEIRARIAASVLSRMDTDRLRRKEASGDFLLQAVTKPSDLVPRLKAGLNRKNGTLS